MAEGLLIIRCVVGGLLFAHGAQKLFGWWGGYGLEGTGGFFASVGHRPGRSMALLAGGAEAGGGGLLVLGLFTPLGSAMVMGVMIVAAVSVHARNGLWATNGGYELPLVNAVVSCGLGFTGAGPWSVDAMGIPGMSGWWSGVGAILLGVVTASLTLMRRQHVLTEVPDAEAYPATAVTADAATAEESAR